MLRWRIPQTVTALFPTPTPGAGWKADSGGMLCAVGIAGAEAPSPPWRRHSRTGHWARSLTGEMAKERGDRQPARHWLQSPGANSRVPPHPLCPQTRCTNSHCQSGKGREEGAPGDVMSQAGDTLLPCCDTPHWRGRTHTGTAALAPTDPVQHRPWDSTWSWAIPPATHHPIGVGRKVPERVGREI